MKVERHFTHIGMYLSHLKRLDTLSPPFQEKSEKFKTMWGKQRHNHTMSRRCYARLAHIMEKTSSADIPITRTKVWVEGHKNKNGQPSVKLLEKKWNFKDSILW
ncbi:uncharacterized protein [Primulina eburnea]|uniref:uncharacterized protein n=1 Tax=Primulina eburnea TaxID=1245227 RepID=UPI003C6C6404